MIYNTFTGALAYVDQEVKNLVIEDPVRIEKGILVELQKNGIVVEDQVDEKKILAYHFNCDKYKVHDLVYILVMTYACNLACPYCYEGKKDAKSFDDKNLNILLSHIEKKAGNKNFNRLEVGLYGGEPLLAPKMCIKAMKSLSQFCDSIGIEFGGGIVTNGTLITQKLIEDLLEPYCGTIQISLDGGKGSHDKKRVFKNGRGTYDILLDVLGMLKDHRGISIRLNVDKDSITSCADLFDDLMDRGLNNIPVYVGWLHDYSHGFYSTRCFLHTEMADVEENLYEEMAKRNISYVPRTYGKHVPCAFDRDEIFLVDPYLDVYKCWSFVGLGDKKVGHIDSGGKMVFNDEFYNQMSRNPLEFEPCNGCKYLPACGGGCAAQALSENGTYLSGTCGRFKCTIDKDVSAYVKRRYSSQV